MKKLLFIPLFIWPATMLSAQVYVSTTGNDVNGNGNFNNPYASLNHAVTVAAAGDTIFLRGGNYSVTTEIRIETDDLHIMSYPGEWAVLNAPVNNNNMANPIWYYDPEMDGGSLENMEITGGYYYGIKLESNWDWDDQVPFNQRSGVKNIVFRNLKIHDTGRDAIKITPACSTITIESCEIYNTGIGPANQGNPNAEGIDAVNAHYIHVRNCYIHNTSTTGMYFKGGSTHILLEANLIKDAGDIGIGLGFYTDAEFFNTDFNPDYRECIECTAQNNFIIGTEYGGISGYACMDCHILHNTIINAAQTGHAPLFFNRGYVWIDNNTEVYPANYNVTVLNNLIDQNGFGQDDVIGVRDTALEGTNTINYNLFYATGTPQAYDNTLGNQALTSWNTLTGFNAQSLIADPQLNANEHLNAGSPAINAGTNSANITGDYDGNNRDANPDIGADEAGGIELSIPPAPGTIGTGGMLDIDVYPEITFTLIQPAVNSLGIMLPEEASSEKYFIFDASGKILQQGALYGGMQYIEVSALSPGIYYLSLGAQARAWIKL